MNHPARLTLVAAVLALAALPAAAGPQDTKVGETRIAYAKAGTPIRAEAAPLAKPVATLPAGTPVRVIEVKLPWVKVAATVGGQAAEGWLRAFEAIEPEALAKPAPPPDLANAGSTGPNARDVSAAGRQFDSTTERGYKTSRADLARAYPQVDEIERTTSRSDPYEAIGFLMEGDLGRRGRDYVLPAHLPPDPDPPDEQAGSGGRGGGGVPGIPGGLGGLLGKRGKDIEKGARLFAGAARLKRMSEQMSTRFSPQQEYYLGRAVAANAIAKYGLDPDARRRAYVRRVGEAVVRVADPARVPDNFGGYHFDVLASDEVNGVSGPGGFVLVTRGAVEACRTEDELAGLLAHELAHVTLRHGEAVIRRSQAFQQRAKAFGALVGLVADAADVRVPAQILDLFTSAVETAVGTSVDHAYGKDLELDADSEGTNLLFDVFYDWTALQAFLVRHAASGLDHGDTATHAAPAQRAGALAPLLARYGAWNGREGTLAFRKTRFETSLGRAK